ncbi:MAG: BREX system Lon protease-like protein BrxL, partial [Chlorobiaceae bacterium]
MIELDYIDKKAASALEGYLVRKDLVRTFSRLFPVPTYVVEFLLGRYCASTNQEEIEEGLDIVERQLASRTVKAGEEELFKVRAKETGEVKIIDLLTARLDAKNDSYVASLPSLRLSDVRISPELVNAHERMLTGGFYAEITLNYDAAIAQENKGRPFGIQSLREIQLSKRDVLGPLAEARNKFTNDEWIIFLLRSIGIEAIGMTDRQKNAFMLRMVPFVERNYNLVEIGPKGTGKSHLFQQISPYAHLVSGTPTPAKLFINNASGERGMLCQYDTVCIDEVSKLNFDKETVGTLQTYMESGEFSRGTGSIRADGSLVFLGNFDVDVEHQQR